MPDNCDRSSGDKRDLALRLDEALKRRGSLAVAVSGGVDSMTLAYIAHRLLKRAVIMVHAQSPAVPPQATQRVRDYASREGWELVVTTAGEFDDPAYRANPVDRCYYCKSNLYDRIRAITPRVIASGANLDDLDDYRPGLVAAAERAVVHPYVEAAIDKAGVRELARRHDLRDIAELAAQPCLSSRVETGIAIDADDLAFIDEVEKALSGLVHAGTSVRCRITRLGIIVELDEDEMRSARLAADLALRFCAQSNRTFGGVRAYRRGAAFLRIATA